MSPRRPLRALVLMLVLAGCAADTPPAPGPGGPGSGPEAVPLTLFFLVNQSGRPARVEARADGRILFGEALPAEGEAGGPRTGAIPSGHPALELKVPLARTARTLEVTELTSGAAVRVDLTARGAPHLGFRIVVESGGLRVSRDYYPMR